ncbi:MAG: filamentous hemagglutinin N-terminal domain-containing protein, partial [Gammaproteobacteria bacterium]|nr:filamentous hemagglutinin N-terminal domain-containing protein [Gammaproteobacteria bacterium]
MAAPQGGEIVAGQGSITAPSSSMTQIQQLSNNMVVDWSSFDVAVNERVQFTQPSSTSAALNRINGTTPSQIFGSIDANGLIFLMNQNGVIFGESARINVGGLVVTDLDVNSDRFMSGDYQLESLGMLNGSIVNRGIISASTGGVSLVSDTGVINEGQILATAGNINLAVANTATLDFDGDGLLQFNVSGDVIENAQSLDAAISNSGEIMATGGDVLISGQVARGVFTNVVNNSGVIKATRVLNEGGVVMLTGSASNINNSGTLDVSGNEAGDVIVNAENITHTGLIDASANNGNAGNITLQSSADTFLQGQSVIAAQADNGTGGTVNVLGNRVGLFDQSSINVSGVTGGGVVLIGGDYQGSNTAIQNASQTYVATDVSISADAIDEGNGGKVIVWADNTTQYYGDISAQGGSLSGNGGFVEVSGKGWLDFSGYVDTSAINGEFGTLLLDPKNIIIENAGAGVATATVSFADAADPGPDSRFDGDSLAALDSNILLQASNDITINEAIPATATTGKMLTMQAGRSILINANLTTNNADITLIANETAANGVVDADRDLGDAVITMADGTTIDAGSGNISITLSTGAGLTNSSSGDITLETLTTTGDVTVANNGTTAGSDVLQDQNSTTVGGITANNITLSSANGGIGTTGAINTTTTTSLSLTTGGVGSTGNISIAETVAGLISKLSITTDASVQSIDLTAASWTVDAPLDLGVDTLALRASDASGDIAGNDTASNILAASAITLENQTIAGAADIGYVGNTAHIVYISTPDLTGITGGAFNINNAVEFSDLTLELDPSTANNVYAIAAGGNQTVTIADVNNVGIQFAFADTSPSDVNITLHNTAPGSGATHADIEIRDGDINAGAGTVSLISDSQDIIQQSSGSVITAGSLLLSAARHITVDAVVSSIAAVSSGAGDIDIGNTGALNVTAVGPDALGNTVTGISTGNGTITIASTGTITVSEDISNTGNNDISITSSAGDIEGVAGVNGVISTTDPAATILLDAFGGIGLLNPIKTSATILDLTTNGTTTLGDIAIENAIALDIGNVALSVNGSGHIFDISASSITVGTNSDLGSNTVFLRSTVGNIDDGSAGAAGNTLTASALGLESAGFIDVSTVASNVEAIANGTIRIDSSYSAGDFTIGGVDAAFSGVNTLANQAITITSADANLVISEAINAGSGAISLTTTDSGAANYNIGGAATVTAGGGLTANADGSINLLTDLQSTGGLTLTTAGDNAAGNITIVDVGDIDTGSVSITTNGANATARTVDLTALSWEINGAFAVAGIVTNIDLNLTATETLADPTTKPHGIFNATGGGADTISATGVLTLTSATGIGTSLAGATAVSDILVSSAGLALATTGAAAAGDIHVDATGTALSLSSVSTDASGQTISITGDSIDLAGSFGDANDTINLTAATGNIFTSAGTVTANSLTLNAAGGIGIGGLGLVNTAANSLDLTSAGTAGAGAITLTNGGAAIIVNASTAAASAEVVTLTADSFELASSFGDANDTISLTATTGDIFTSSGTVTASSLILDAAGGIGIGGAVNTAAGSLSLTTAGNDAAGNITIVDSGDLSTASVSVVTNGTNTATRTVDLTAQSWQISGAFAVTGTATNIDLKLTATELSAAVPPHGIYNAGGADSISATGTITLTSATGIGSLGSPIKLTAGGIALATSGVGVDGNIYVDATGSTLSLGAVSTDASAQTVDLTADEWVLAGAIGNATDSLTLTASVGNIYSTSGTVTANVLTLNAAGGIGIGGLNRVDTAANNLILITNGVDTAGNIIVVDAGDLSTSNVSVTANGANAGTRVVDLIAKSWQVDSFFGVTSLGTIDLSL